MGAVVGTDKIPVPVVTAVAVQEVYIMVPLEQRIVEEAVAVGAVTQAITPGETAAAE